MGQTEKELLEAVGNGEMAALRELYDRLGAAVHACSTVLAQRLGAPPADEITVAAFTNLWHLGPTLDRDRPVLGSLLRLAARAAASAAAPVPVPAQVG